MEIKNPHLERYATGDVFEDKFLLMFSAYLFKVIRGTAARFWKRHRARISQEILVDDFTFNDCGVVPSDDFVGSSLVDVTADGALLAAIGALTKSQRLVLEAYVLRRLPMQMIAQERHVSQTAVYALMRRGLERMRMSMEEGDQT
ncbi:MAG: sigma-70 family RNA polymerase sigma factor [Clostridia bacterium]